jgi:hypothetical protein
VEEHVNWRMWKDARKMKVKVILRVIKLMNGHGVYANEEEFGFGVISYLMAVPLMSVARCVPCIQLSCCSGGFELNNVEGSDRTNVQKPNFELTKPVKLWHDWIR